MEKTHKRFVFKSILHLKKKVLRCLELQKYFNILNMINFNEL